MTLLQKLTHKPVNIVIILLILSTITLCSCAVDYNNDNPTGSTNEAITLEPKKILEFIDDTHAVGSANVKGFAIKNGISENEWNAVITDEYAAKLYKDIAEFEVEYIDFSDMSANNVIEITFQDHKSNAVLFVAIYYENKNTVSFIDGNFAKEHTNPEKTFKIKNGESAAKLLIELLEKIDRNN